MRCRKVRSLLSAFCNEELTGRRQSTLREHLAGCALCRREAAFYDQLGQESPKMTERTVSMDFNTSLLNRIANERYSEIRSKAYLPTRAPRIAWRLVLPVVTTAVLAVFMVINLVPSLSIDSDRPLAVQPGAGDDAYRTIQPVNNPNMTANLQKDWSLSHQLAMAERINRISRSLTNRTGFGSVHLTGSFGPSVVNPNRRAPYAMSYHRIQKVFRTYQGLTPRTQEGEKVY